MGWPPIPDDRTCLNCGSGKAYRNHWYKYKDGFICKKCYHKLVSNPKWSPINNPIKNHRKMRFKNERIVLKDNPRTGYCSLCPNNIYNGSCKVTGMHHIAYHDDDPLKDTIELCQICHRLVHAGKLILPKFNTS